VSNRNKRENHKQNKKPTKNLKENSKQVVLSDSKRAEKNIPALPSLCIKEPPAEGALCVPVVIHFPVWKVKPGLIREKALILGHLPEEDD